MGYVRCEQQDGRHTRGEDAVIHSPAELHTQPEPFLTSPDALASNETNCCFCRKKKRDALQNSGDFSVGTDLCSPTIHRHQSEDVDTKAEQRRPEEVVLKDQDITPGREVSLKAQEDPTTAEELTVQEQEDLTPSEDLSPRGQEDTTPREALHPKGQEDLISTEDLSPESKKDHTQAEEAVALELDIAGTIALHAKVEDEVKGVGKAAEETAPKAPDTVARKSVKGRHVARQGLVSPESPDADHAWLGRHPRRCQQTPHFAVLTTLRSCSRSEGANFKDSRNGVLLPPIDTDSQSKGKSWTHLPKPKWGSRKLSKVKARKLPALTSPLLPSHQRHRSTSPTRFPPSPASRAENEETAQHPPKRSWDAKPVKPLLKPGSNSPPPQPPPLPTITLFEFALPVSYGRPNRRHVSPSKKGIVVSHPYLLPLPRRKLEGSPGELLRGVHVSPAETKMLRASLVQPQPVSTNVVFARAVNPPFNFSLTKEQHMRFLAMYRGAMIY